jgi:lambda family phage tail tape measure protein
MEDALVKFVTTGKLSFTDLANSIVADITRIVIKQMMMNAIGGGSGGAGWFGSLVGMGMGAMFGTAGTATVASAMPGNSMDNMMSLTGGFGTVPGSASGGIVNAKGLYQINERGPEVLSVAGKQYLMVGNQDATVSQNSGSGQMVSVTNNFTLNVPADRRTQAQIASAAGQSVQRAMARNT